MSSAHVAVIGAGIAGITAARQLSSAGQSVQVFEKSRGSGGRLASKRSTMGRVNLGAQSFNAEDAEFIAQLHSWQQAGWVEHSTTEPNHWTGTPYMSALTRNLLGEVQTHFACEISSLHYTNDGWQLHDQHGHSHGPFQQVLVAIPAPQAKVLLSTCAPELAIQAASVVMQPAWIVVLSFAEAITLPSSLKQLHNSTVAELIYTPQSTAQALSILTLRATTSWSSQHLEEQSEQVIAALTDACNTLLDTPLPTTVNAFAHRWRYALGALAQPSGLLAEPQRGLYIAGDWCGLGDVESAWRSGTQAAQQILKQQ